MFNDERSILLRYQRDGNQNLQTYKYKYKINWGKYFMNFFWTFKSTIAYYARKAHRTTGNERWINIIHL